MSKKDENELEMLDRPVQNFKNVNFVIFTFFLLFIGALAGGFFLGGNWEHKKANDKLGIIIDEITDDYGSPKCFDFNDLSFEAKQIIENSLKNISKIDFNHS